MRRFRDYYRQFEALAPEEVSRELRARRDAERARALAEVPPLDLAGAAWHEPPHPEVINAGTYALRRAVNRYPDPGPAVAALAAAHDVAPERIVLGHGAGELLRAALRALAAEGEVLLPWPAWGPLPDLAAEAGATAVPVPLGGDGAPDPVSLRGALTERTRALVVCRPNDPTGGLLGLEEVRALAADLPPDAWLVLDEALAGFLPPGEAGLVEHPRVLHVRSASKDHAMAGLRVGHAVLPEGAPPGLARRIAPVSAPASPALAGLHWATEHGEPLVARRRAAAARERDRLAAALAGSPWAFPPGHGPYVWLSSAATGAREVAEALAARRIFVTPGDERHVRVTLRGPAATDRLAAALLEIAGP